MRVTDGAPLALMDDEAALADALAGLADSAVTHDRAEAVLIGGGPLGPVAAAVARRVGVPVIDPVAAGIALIGERLGVAAPSDPPVVAADRDMPPSTAGRFA